ncbi:UNVERIFIED_CONTAM: hypothetical protein Slati_1151800 [Sesamum latifolium]|uniref:Uncharacterized protein n=1 Tax=Sesamum latifolium TaxID=2727402 RepID=A0AAW2XC23_9LAMI
MMLRVEKQRQVQIDYMDSAHSVIVTSKGFESSQGAGNYSGRFDRKNKVDKRSLFCAHCKKIGHAKEHCLKLHGYPDWYKDLMDQKGRNSQVFTWLTLMELMYPTTMRLHHKTDLFQK